MSKPKVESKVKVPDQVILELLTPSEVRMLKNRWKIINLLKSGLSIRSIAEEVQVGTDTVVRVSRMLEKGDLKKILNKDSSKAIRTNTPWVFGKSD